jgi:hypothetical protein
MLTFEERVLCGNPLQRFGSRLEPDPEPTREFGPVANTSGMCIDPAQYCILNYQLPGSKATLSQANWLQMGLQDET